MIVNKLISYLTNKKKDKIKIDYPIINKSSKKKILVANIISGHRFCSIIETSIAMALKLRGHDVSFLQCDKALDACVMCIADDFKNNDEFLEKGAKKICSHCWDTRKNIFFDTLLPVKKISNYISKKEIEGVHKFFDNTPLNKLNKSFKFKNINIGDQSIAGCIRYLGKSIVKTKKENLIKKKYFVSSAILVIALKRLFKTEKFDTIFFNHGIYVPHGIVINVAKSEKIRLVCYGKGYRTNTLIFDRDETYHKTMIDEDTSIWKKTNLISEYKKKLLTYLKSRRKGTNDWTTYLDNPKKNSKLINKFKEKPVILILTNVDWDAQIYYKNNIFKNMHDWIIFTIKYFVKRNDLNIIVRIHPAELSGTVPSKLKVNDVILNHFKKLPENITIIKPDDKLSTYDLAKIADCAIVYGTKMGVELSPFGLHTIVCGEAWIKNKGITIDIKSKNNYRNILNKLPFKKKLTKSKILLAQKYAYYYFFRKMIKINFIKKIKKYPFYVYNYQHINKLRPGRDKGLDIICDGIVDKNVKFLNENN